MAQWIYGKNTVMDAVDAGVKINEILVFNQDEKFLSKLQNKKIRFRKVSKRDVDKVASGNHQGIAAQIDDFKFSTVAEILSVKAEHRIVVILDQIEDPHNFGAILRTCDAAGVAGVIIQDKRQVDVTPTVAKVSTGATNHMKIAKVPNIIRAIEELKKDGFWIIGTDANNAQDYRSIDYKMNCGIVIGSEGKGIRDLVLKNCDLKVYIPMVGSVTSLNASVASALLVYEAFSGQNPVK